ARGSTRDALIASTRSDAELALDRGEIAPGGFARDLAVAKLEDVQQAEAHRPALAVAQERLAILDAAVPQRLVDDEVLAVEAADGRHALPLHVAEQQLVV